MKKKVLKNLEKLNIKNDYLIVGVSAGPDSMYLLNLLIENNFNIVAAHVNYNKRKESVEEAKYLEDYCLKNNIVYEKLSIKKYSKGNFQEEARNIRYDFFKKLAKKYKTKYIITAHHGDDLIETILMRLVRGSTVAGYYGFREINKEEGFIYLKPLIELSKEEIVNYLNENKIKYYIDSSNECEDYTRNRYRKNIIPLLKKENIQLIDKFNNFSEQLYFYNEYITNEALKNIKRIYKNKTILLKEFNSLDNVIKEKALEIILKEIYNDDIKYITKINILDIIKLCNNKSPNLVIFLPNKLIVRKSYDKLFFEFESLNTIDYNIIINDIIKLPNGNIIRFSKEKKDTSNYSICLKKQDIELPLIVRNRKNGDKIKVKNSGTQKVNDIFINNKIGIKDRNEYIIDVDSKNTILWIPGLKKSKYDCKDDFDIILEYIEKGK